MTACDWIDVINAGGDQLFRFFKEFGLYAMSLVALLIVAWGVRGRRAK